MNFDKYFKIKEYYGHSFDININKLSLFKNDDIIYKIRLDKYGENYKDITKKYISKKLGISLFSNSRDINCINHDIRYLGSSYNFDQKSILYCYPSLQDMNFFERTENLLRNLGIMLDLPIEYFKKTYEKTILYGLNVDNEIDFQHCFESNLTKFVIENEIKKFKECHKNMTFKCKNITYITSTLGLHYLIKYFYIMPYDDDTCIEKLHAIFNDSSYFMKIKEKINDLNKELHDYFKDNNHIEFDDKNENINVLDEYIDINKKKFTTMSYKYKTTFFLEDIINKYHYLLSQLYPNVEYPYFKTNSPSRMLGTLFLPNNDNDYGSLNMNNGINNFIEFNKYLAFEFIHIINYSEPAFYDKELSELKRIQDNLYLSSFDIFKIEMKFNKLHCEFLDEYFVPYHIKKNAVCSKYIKITYNDRLLPYRINENYILEIDGKKLNLRKILSKNKPKYEYDIIASTVKPKYEVIHKLYNICNLKIIEEVTRDYILKVINKKYLNYDIHFRHPCLWDN